ncbi:MAG: hypothetical protein LIP16_20595 [Clostridium sp.]|nr:hypothetical protein [Clostridium sp.]
MRIKKKILAALAAAMTMLFVFPAYAGDLQSTTFFTGTVALIESATKALTALAFGLTVLLGLVNGFAWQTADENEKANKKRSFVKVISIGVLITCLSGLLTVIFGFYGGTT